MRVAEVQTQYSGFPLLFDAKDLEIELGKQVVVETKRGHEIGELVCEIYEADPAELGKNKAKQPVLREANYKDLEKYEYAQSKAREALPVFKRLAAEECKDMRPVAVEYLLDGDKAVFYFEAENRVDFRSLIKNAPEWRARRSPYAGGLWFLRA